MRINEAGRRNTIHAEQSMGHANQPWSELVRGIAAFSLLVAAIVLLWRDNLVLLLALLVESLAALGLWHDRYDLSVFVIVGVLGSLAEAVFVRFGVWQYANPTLLGVPLWFPFAFGTSALIGKRLVCTITVI
jgi:uncharacterized membrane protein YoaT (DUF817 family)